MYSAKQSLCSRKDNMNKFYVPGIIVGILVVVNTSKAYAAVINFDDQGLVGPSYFTEAGHAKEINVPTTAGNVQLEGGVILTNPVNLPADKTSLYSTVYSPDYNVTDPSFKNPLTVKFDKPVNNFFLDVFNGYPEDTNYTVADNAGNSATFTLPPNLQSGQKQIGFAATGTEVTIKSSLHSKNAYDFFIDNIHFDEPLPTTIPAPTTMTSVPEPNSALGTLTFSVLIGGLFLKRKTKRLNMRF